MALYGGPVDLTLGDPQEVWIAGPDGGRHRRTGRPVLGLDPGCGVELYVVAITPRAFSVTERQTGGRVGKCWETAEDTLHSLACYVGRDPAAAHAQFRDAIDEAPRVLDLPVYDEAGEADA